MNKNPELSSNIIRIRYLCVKRQYFNFRVYVAHYRFRILKHYHIYICLLSQYLCSLLTGTYKYVSVIFAIYISMNYHLKYAKLILRASLLDYMYSRQLIYV
jgi:hypothetical protein